jgi:hypothetical protein
LNQADELVERCINSGQRVKLEITRVSATDPSAFLVGGLLIGFLTSLLLNPPKDT